MRRRNVWRAVKGHLTGSYPVPPPPAREVDQGAPQRELAPFWVVTSPMNGDVKTFTTSSAAEVYARKARGFITPVVIERRLR